MPSSQQPLYYYLNERQEPVGPISFETISSLVRSGQLPASVPVAQAGGAEWIPYSTWLAASSAPSLPPIPPSAARPEQARPGVRTPRGGSPEAALPPLPSNPLVPGAQPKPPSHMVWAILITCLCCIPLGAIAIAKASLVDSHYYAGRYNEAVQASRSAAKWCIWGGLLGILGSVTFVMLEHWADSLL